MRAALLLFIAIATFSVGGAVVASPLADYAAQPDDAFDFEVASAYRASGATVYNVRLVSQIWRGVPWTHWLALVVPDQLQQRRHALLVIGGGVNADGPPPPLDGAGRAVVEVARETGSIAAIISQVPNQPLFDGKYEDEIIAQTFDEFLAAGDPELILLFPMVKSAVRAMDAVQGLARRHAAASIESFVVTGASKRGWTTFLTAAVDERVTAMAPMVIDMLNIPAQLRHQRRAYGGYSPQIGDYTELDLPSRIDSDEGRMLLRLVDPHAYRGAYTMPKLVLLGTNDPFWTVDSASIYWEDLPAPKWLHYMANAGHGLGAESVHTLAAFHRAMTTEATLPKLNWERRGDALAVTWDDARGQAYLWQAWSPNRDYRQAEWTRERLAGDGEAAALVDPPDEGWTASFVEVRWPDGPLGAYGLTTEIVVVPETYPHEE